VIQPGYFMEMKLWRLLFRRWKTAELAALLENDGHHKLLRCRKNCGNKLKGQLCDNFRP
jgi:hypothetical protein